MTADVEIVVLPDGSLQMIHDDDVSAQVFDASEATVRRASHVEPECMAWIADLSPVDGPLLGPFPTRREALEAEVAWLRERLADRLVHPQ